MGHSVSMFLVQVVKGVQGVDNLHVCDPCSPQPLEEVYLLDGETRLLTLLEHPGWDHKNSRNGKKKRKMKHVHLCQCKVSKGLEH